MKKIIYERVFLVLFSTCGLSLWSTGLPKGNFPAPVTPSQSTLMGGTTSDCQNVAFAEPRLSFFGEHSFVLVHLGKEHVIYQVAPTRAKKIISFESQDYPAFARLADSQFLLFRQIGCTGVASSSQWVGTVPEITNKPKATPPPLGTIRVLKVYTQEGHDAIYDMDKKELVSYSSEDFSKTLLFRSERPVLYWIPSQSLATVLSKPFYIENFFKTLSGKRSHRQLAPTERIDIRARGVVLTRSQNETVELHNRGKKKFSNTFLPGIQFSQVRNDFDGKLFLSYTSDLLKVSQEGPEPDFEYMVKASDPSDIGLAWIWGGRIFVLLENKTSREMTEIITWVEGQWKKLALQ